jgi:hypothetical protein
VEELRKRALREPRRKRLGLYFHGTAFTRDERIRGEGICAPDGQDGPYLADDPMSAFFIAARDSWRTNADDDRGIVYAVRADSSALRPHPNDHELLEWIVANGRVPPSWIVAHAIIVVPRNFKNAVGRVHTEGFRNGALAST